MIFFFSIFSVIRLFIIVCQRVCAVVISMVWQMFSLEKSFRQYMVVSNDLPETERNQAVLHQNQVKSWFGNIAFTECRKQYEAGRKLKRVLLWKSQEQAEKEGRIKKIRKRNVDKRLARLQTLHWLIEQQFKEGGATLSSQLNSTSATNTNLVRLCVALNNIFTHKKVDEKYSLSDFLTSLADKLESLSPADSPTYKSADVLLRKLQLEYNSITQKAAEYAKTVNGAIAIDKTGWDLAEDFDPDVV